MGCILLMLCLSYEIPPFRNPHGFGMSCAEAGAGAQQLLFFAVFCSMACSLKCMYFSNAFPAQLSTRPVCETARTSGGFNSKTWCLHHVKIAVTVFAGLAHDAKPFVFVTATAPTCTLVQIHDAHLQPAAVTHF
jgi:hypothetical protein